MRILNLSGQSKVKRRLILGFSYRNKPLSTVSLYLWKHMWENKTRKKGCCSSYDGILLALVVQIFYSVLLISMLGSGTLLTTMKSLSQLKMACVNLKALVWGRH